MDSPETSCSLSSLVQLLHSLSNEEVDKCSEENVLQSKEVASLLDEVVNFDSKLLLPFLQKCYKLLTLRGEKANLPQAIIVAQLNLRVAERRNMNGALEDHTSVSTEVSSQAQNDFLDALKQLGDCYQLLGDETKSSPIFARYYSTLSDYQKQRKNSDALKNGKLAVKYSAKHPGTTSLLHIGHKTKLAGMLHAVGKLQKATRELQEALEFLEELPLNMEHKKRELLRMLSDVYVERSMYEEALVALQSCLTGCITSFGYIHQETSMLAMCIGRVYERYAASRKAPTPLCYLANAIR